MAGVPLIAAFTAGLISFLSPCVLPLVPGYISLISGASVEELQSGGDGRLLRKVLLHSSFFIIGFSLVFISLGASATWLGQLLLSRDKRFHNAGTGTTPAGALVIGLAFAFGWTPCIGPILAAILALAASQTTIMAGVFLLAIYSLGL